MRAWDVGLPCWVKLGVRSIEESDQKDVDADRVHMPWTACARCQLEIQHRGSMSVGNLKNLRQVNHNYCGILYYSRVGEVGKKTTDLLSIDSVFSYYSIH